MKRRYYGWNVAFVCAGLFLISAVTATLGIFFPALKATHGFMQAEVSMIVSFYMIGSLASAPFYNPVFRKINVRFALLLFVLIQSVAVFGMSRTGSLTVLYAFGFIAGFFGTNIPMLSQLLITNWFNKKRATAMAVVMAGIGVNQVFLIPFLVRTMSNYTYQLAFIYYASTMVIIGIIGFIVVKDSPAKFGLEKDGIIRFGGNAHEIKAKSRTVNIPVKRVIRHRSFISLQIMHQIINVVAFFVGLQLASYLTTIGFSAIQIASFYTILGIVSFFARFVIGILIDRMGLARANLVWGTFGILSVAGLILLPISPVFRFIYIFCSGVGLAYAQVTTPIAFSRFYGEETFPRLQPISKVISGICLAVGVAFSGVIIDILGFSRLFTIALILFVLAVFIGNIAMKSGAKLQKEYQEQAGKNI